MEDQPEQEVTVSVSDQHLGRLAEIAEQLQRAGMTVAKVRKITGTISGSAAPSKLDDLRGVEGVLGVEVSRTYRPQ